MCDVRRCAALAEFGRDVRAVAEHHTHSRPRQGRNAAGPMIAPFNCVAVPSRRRRNGLRRESCSSTMFESTTPIAASGSLRLALLVGYAHCSTDQHDLTAQRDALLKPGVAPDRIYVGTNRERPGLREALAACRAGDTLVVTKPDRLARPLPDARAIAAELTIREVSLSLGGSVYDATDVVRRLVFNVLAMVRRVGIRPDPAPHPRGHEGRQGQGPTTRQAAQAQPSPRGPPWAPWCTAASTTPPRSTDPDGRVSRIRHRFGTLGGAGPQPAQPLGRSSLNGARPPALAEACRAALGVESH